MVEQFITDLRRELLRAQAKHKPYNSAHEAYAVILEELDEFWEEVRKKRHQRNPYAMYEELLQIATTAWRAVLDLDLVPDRKEEESI